MSKIKTIKINAKTLKSDDIAAKGVGLNLSTDANLSFPSVISTG